MSWNVPPQLLERGLGAWHGHAWYEGGSCSGGGWGYGPEPNPAEGPIADGALILDKRAVLERDPGACWRSPLPGLKADTCPDPGLLRLSGWAGYIEAHEAAKASRPGPGPLDTVNLADYRRWWRLHGARSGRWNAEAGRVEWDADPGTVRGTPAADPAGEQLAAL